MRHPPPWFNFQPGREAAYTGWATALQPFGRAPPPTLKPSDGQHAATRRDRSNERPKRSKLWPPRT
ncbi:hypothetical protein RHCRD62_10082 [Rhodococcus sp. RD6.2]|nr:hypothetical protein RHCRD62_10082 [Rhodococcus sp. RD6.2]